MNMFYYFILFVPVGILFSICSKKEKVIVDAFVFSVLLSLIFMLCLQLGFIPVKINFYDMFIFNVVGGVVGSYLYTLTMYIIKKYSNKKLDKDINN
ncbi:MAG: hypothetical protein MJ245_06430 [Clostridia bacterium]|nr:hypothetical protein [Clostridia bacterium]